MNKKLIVMLIPLLSSFSLPVVAEKDGKIYSASQCQPADYSAYRLFSFTNGRLRNTYSTRKTVICPIVSDLISTTKNGVYNIKIKAFDRNYQAGDPKVSCTMYSARSNGIYYASSSTSSKPGGVNLLQELVIPKALNTSVYGSLFLRCSIPGYYEVSGSRRYSSLVSYQVTEQD